MTSHSILSIPCISLVVQLQMIVLKLTLCLGNSYCLFSLLYIYILVDNKRYAKVVQIWDLKIIANVQIIYCIIIVNINLFRYKKYNSKM